MLLTTRSGTSVVVVVDIANPRAKLGTKMVVNEARNSIKCRARPTKTERLLMRSASLDKLDFDVPAIPTVHLQIAGVEIIGLRRTQLSAYGMPAVYRCANERGHAMHVCSCAFINT